MAKRKHYYKTHIRKSGNWHASGWFGRHATSGKGSTRRGKKRVSAFGRPAGRYRRS